MQKNHFTRDNSAVTNYKTVSMLIRVAVPLFLLAGGITLLALRISGWSLIFGLPVTVLGVVFLVYTYDGMVNASNLRGKNLANCKICNNLEEVEGGEFPDDYICKSCRRDIQQGLKNKL